LLSRREDVDARHKAGHDEEHNNGLILVSCSRSAIHLERSDEGFLQDVDLAELPHLILAFLLLALGRFAVAGTK
jgi:hypothetical protein